MNVMLILCTFVLTTRAEKTFQVGQSFIFNHLIMHYETLCITMLVPITIIIYKHTSQVI
jgi:hypothetical protein